MRILARKSLMAGALAAALGVAQVQEAGDSNPNLGTVEGRWAVPGASPAAPATAA